MNENTFVAVRRQATGSGRTRLIGTLFVALVIMLLAVAQASAAANSKPPLGQFVSPQNGGTVSGVVMVKVFAPALAQFKAEFGVDGANWQPMQYKGDGAFQLRWNTAYTSNDKHTLTARFSLLGSDRPPTYTISIQVLVQNEDADPPPEAGILPLACAPADVTPGLRPNPCRIRGVS